MNQNPTQSKPADSEQPSGEGVVVQRLVGRLRDFAAEYAASNPPAYLQVSGQEAAKLIDWLDTAHRLIDQIEGERDRYAALLCEAMQVVYATKCHGDSTDLIDRFESLELTPCFSANAQVEARLVRCCACTGTGINPHLPGSQECYTCEGRGQRPTCYTCGTPLYRNSFTDGWFCCVHCEEAKTKETTDFLTANTK